MKRKGTHESKFIAQSHARAHDRLLNMKRNSLFVHNELTVSFWSRIMFGRCDASCFPSTLGVTLIT